MEKGVVAPHWGVFICYRQVDGSEVAEWLYSKLHDRPVLEAPATRRESPKLVVYFDQTVPAVADWTAKHQPALERAKAFLMVCSPGAAMKAGKEDWVHRELEWWLAHKLVAPILIDPLGSEGDRWVPDLIKKHWPNAQRIKVLPANWERRSAENRDRDETRAISRIVQGILESHKEIRGQEDKDENRQRSVGRWRQLLFRSLAAAAVLTVFTLGSFGFSRLRLPEEVVPGYGLAVTSRNRLSSTLEFSFDECPADQCLPGVVSIVTLRGRLGAEGFAVLNLWKPGAIAPWLAGVGFGLAEMPDDSLTIRLVARNRDMGVEVTVKDAENNEQRFSCDLPGDGLARDYVLSVAELHRRQVDLSRVQLIAFGPSHAAGSPQGDFETAVYGAVFGAWPDARACRGLLQ